jgi:hypothetical protein
MFSQLLLQIDAAWPVATSVMIILLTAGLVFFGGHFLARRCHRQEEPTSRKSSSILLNQTPTPRPEVPRQVSIPVRVTDACCTVEPVPGYVTSRTAEGVVVEMLEEGQLVAGTKLNVRPTHADASFPWVLVEVGCCRKQGSCWVLECRYVRTPPYSLRMQFG